MTKSIAETSRALKLRAGEHARSRAFINKRGAKTCIVYCKLCGPHGWTSPSDGVHPGQGGSLGFTLDVWAVHLHEKHSIDLSAVAYVDAKRRLEEREALSAVAYVQALDRERAAEGT